MNVHSSWPTFDFFCIYAQNRRLQGEGKKRRMAWMNKHPRWAAGGELVALSDTEFVWQEQAQRTLSYNIDCLTSNRPRLLPQWEFLTHARTSDWPDTPVSKSVSRVQSSLLGGLNKLRYMGSNPAEPRVVHSFWLLFRCGLGSGIGIKVVGLGLGIKPFKRTNTNVCMYHIYTSIFFFTSKRRRNYCIVSISRHFVCCM